jgi:glycosyltransferase involved in cell wall biosynthesis
MSFSEVSVVIPARNEQETLGPILDRLNAAIQRLPQYRFETLVVVDSEADLTIPVAKSRGATVVLSDSGRGKGNALYTGFRKAAGEVLVIFDSDGSHNPEDIGLFLAEIEKGAGLVIGSRVLGGSHDHNVIRLFGNALFTMLMSVLFGTTLMDSLNGYKAFVKGVVTGYRPKARGFDIEIEIVAQAIAKGYKTAEVPSHENQRAGGKMKSNAVVDGYHIMVACLREGAKYQWRRLFRRRLNPPCPAG